MAGIARLLARGKHSATSALGRAPHPNHPQSGLSPQGTRDLDLLHSLVGVVGDMDIDADGFSMVIDLRGSRKGSVGWEDTRL